MRIPSDDLAKILRYLAECVEFTERIKVQNCCNSCGKFKTCEYLPRWGEPTRINCPLWVCEDKEGA